ARCPPWQIRAADPEGARREPTQFGRAADANTPSASTGWVSPGSIRPSSHGWVGSIVVDSIALSGRYSGLHPHAAAVAPWRGPKSAGNADRLRCPLHTRGMPP